MVSPSIWNGLPLTLCSLPRTLSQAFLSQLKMVLFGHAGVAPPRKGAIQILAMNERELPSIRIMIEGRMEVEKQEKYISEDIISLGQTLRAAIDLTIDRGQ